MMYRSIILIIVLLTLSVAAFAQPSPSTAWLRVSVQNFDGTSFSVAPAVSLVMPVAAVNQNNVPKPDGLDVLFLDLTPGTYGVNIVLRGTSIVIPQQTVEVSRGANIFVWKLDPPITVTGEFTLDGKTPVAIKRGLGYDVNNNTGWIGGLGGKGGGGKGRLPAMELNSTFKVTKEGKYIFKVPTPGSYNLKFYTDQGYCDTATYTVPVEAKDGYTAPLVTLTSGGSIKFMINDAKGKPMPKAVAYVTYSSAPVSVAPAKGVISAVALTLGFTANDNGVITTPQLPVGQWSYNATSQIPDPKVPITTQPVNVSGAVSVTLGAVADIKVQMP